MGARETNLLKARLLQFLRRSRPGDVDRKEMTTNRQKDMRRQSPKEQNKHRTPLYTIQKRPQETLLADSMPQKRIRQRTQRIKNDSHTNPHLPRREVKVVDVVGEPPDHDIVGEGERDGGRNGVVGQDVAQDGDLGGYLDVGEEDEAQEEAREGAAGWPADEGVEDEFVAAVGVFFPAGELVVDGEGDAFFEAAVAGGEC